MCLSEELKLFYQVVLAESAKYSAILRLSEELKLFEQVVLAESPKYTGLRLDEAPRNMGDGFVILASNAVSIYYYVDEVRALMREKILFADPNEFA